MKRLTNIFLAFLLIFTLVFTIGLPIKTQAEGMSDLIISEYIEGSGLNKALEIYNGTGQPIDLSNYSLVNFTNGADQFTKGYANELPLSGTLASGEVIVVANSNADQTIIDVADITGSSYFYGFNGDDAIVLFKDYDASTRQGTVIDSIGKVGEDPGDYWGTDVQTANSTLVRNPSVMTGDINIGDSYNPANEWIPFPVDTFDYLGSYNPNIEPPIQEEPKDEYTVTVTSVVDGDTIHIEPAILGSDTVRYLNIDTPETYHLDSYDVSLVDTVPDHSQKYHGELAKEYLKTLLQPGDVVTLKVGEEIQDAYGRILAQVIRNDGLNTNLEMVRKGYAVTYFIWPIGDEAIYNQFQAAVKEASDNKLGIWNETHPLMELPFVFRAREQGKGLLRYVGNSGTKVYYEPEDWAAVPVEKRIFFAEDEAVAAGYTPGFDRNPIVATARYSPVGTIVTVEGVVTFVDGINYYIEDETAGVVIRSKELNGQIGDKICAKGKTSEYYGMLQIETEDVEVIETNVVVPTPNYINATDIEEKLEATLVAVENVTIESVNKYNEYTAKDVNGNTFIIDSDELQLEVGKTYDTVMGVINYSYGSYRIVPRSSSDIIMDIPVISIAEARQADLATKVQIEGIVTGIDGKNYYVQDETAGIVVRVEETGFSASIGDKIRAKARTEEYFDLLEILPILQNVHVIEEGVGVPEPKIVSPSNINENFEAQLIQVKYVTVESKNRFGEYTAVDAEGNQFKIDNTDYVEVGAIYESIVGDLTYNYSEYKLLLRYPEDAIKLDFTNSDGDLSTVSLKIVEATDYLGLDFVVDLLEKQLASLVDTNGNTEQHIETTIHNISISLSKIEQDKNNTEVEMKKIEHELSQLFKKEK